MKRYKARQERKFLVTLRWINAQGGEGGREGRREGGKERFVTFSPSPSLTLFSLHLLPGRLSWHVHLHFHSVNVATIVLSLGRSFLIHDPSMHSLLT